MVDKLQAEKVLQGNSLVVSHQYFFLMRFNLLNCVCMGRTAQQTVYLLLVIVFQSSGCGINGL